MIFLVYLLVVHSYCTTAEACSDGAVRLVGGPNEFEGHVEVCLGGEWGRWCAEDVSVGDEEASVVCRQLHGSDFTGFAMVNSPLYGTESSSVSITDVSCQGSEQEITECAHENATVVGDCREVAVVSPQCGESGDIRLVSGATPSEGLVDVCSGGFRVGLCYAGFTPEAATVLCRQLGFSTSNPGTSADSELRYFTVIFGYDCNGDERDFRDCGLLRESTGIGCSSVRLNCSDSTAPSTDNDKSSTSQSSTTTSTTSSTANSPSLTIIIVVVCVVLVLLLAGSVVIIMVVLCTKRRRNNKVTLQEPGIVVDEKLMDVWTTDDGKRVTIQQDAEYEEILDSEIENVAIGHACATENVGLSAEGNVTYETVTCPIFTGGDMVYETAIPTEGNVAYETAPQSIPTERNVAYETAPQFIPTGGNVAYETAPQFIPTGGNVAYGTAPQSIPTEYYETVQ